MKTKEEKRKEEKRKDFIELAEKNKNNFDLHRLLIAKYIGGWELDVMRNSSVESFYKSGKVSGSLLLGLMEYAEAYANQFKSPPIVETDKLRQEFMNERIYYLDKDKIFDFFLPHLSVSKEVEEKCIEFIEWKDGYLDICDFEEAMIRTSMTTKELFKQFIKQRETKQ